MILRNNSPCVDRRFSDFVSLSRFNVEKGYGFIAIDGAENDIFVHQSDIYAPGFRSLAEGEPVRRPLQEAALRRCVSPH